jgi:hypothetical protein
MLDSFWLRYCALHLAEAERHVKCGAEVVIRQRELIGRLEKSGRNATLAKAMLARFQEMECAFVRRRGSILRDVGLIGLIIRNPLQPVFGSIGGMSTTDEAETPCCPRCQGPMVLARTFAGIGGLPELRSYRCCIVCEEVTTVEYEP